MDRAEIVAAVRTLVGIKWQHQGRTRNGTDCGGLIILTLEQFGVHGYDMLGYPRRPDGTFIKHFRNLVKVKRVNDMADGDILMFSAGKHPCHSGIATTYRGRRGVVHANAMRRKVVEEDLVSAESSVGWVSHCFEFPGVED